jgi:hypothetical protein
MAEVQRSIYFYKVEMVNDGDEWKHADVLRALDAPTGDDQVLALGDENYAWAKVDHIPRAREAGRLRFFRDRRANLPGWASRATSPSCQFRTRPVSSNRRTWSSAGPPARMCKGPSWSSSNASDYIQLLETSS